MDYMDIGDLIVSTLNSDTAMQSEKLPVIPVVAQSAIQGGFVAYQRNNLVVHRAKQIITGYTATYQLSVISPMSFSESSRLSRIVKNAMGKLKHEGNVRSSQFINHTEGYIDGVGYLQSLIFEIEI